MNSDPATIRKTQQYIILLALALSSCILWVNSWHSDIAKQPVLLLGSTFVVALFLATLFLKRTVTVSLSAIEIIVALHVPLFLLSAVFTLNTLYTLDALGFGAACLIFFFSGTKLFTTKKEVSLVFTWIQVLTTLLCLVAFTQYFFGEHLPQFLLVGRINRVTSLLGNSAFFGAYLVLTFPLILSQAIYKRAVNKAGIHTFILPAGIATAIFMTQTRSSIIALGVSALVLSLLSLKRNNAARIIGLLLISATGAAIWIFVLSPNLSHRFTTMFSEGRESTLAKRMYFWNGGVHAFRAAPLFGHGIGSFEQTILSYRSPEYWTVESEDIAPHAHNELIEIATEYGIAGLVLCVLTLGLLAYRGISIARKGKGWEQWTSIGLTCSVIAISVDSFANVGLRQAPIGALAWLFMGLLSSQVLRKEVLYSASFTMPVSKVLVGLPLLAWIALVFFYGRHQLKLLSADISVMQGIANRNVSEAAVRNYEQAVSQNNNNLLALSMLANEYTKSRQWKNALENLERLNSLSPSYPKSFLMKAYIYYNLGEYANASRAIGRELTLRTHPEAYDLQARIFKEISDDKKEREALVSLLLNDLKGGIDYKYRFACVRLAELSRSDEEKKEFVALLDSFQNRTPADRSFFEQLKEQAAGQQSYPPR